MKRLMMISVLAMSMFMTSTNISAQKGEKKRPQVEKREPAKRNDRNNKMSQKNRDRRDGKHGVVAHSQHRNNHAPKQHNHDKMIRCNPPKVKRGAYVPGWEGRVRLHHDGRWGYYHDGCWTYYDCYYDPHVYFSTRPAHQVIIPAKTYHEHSVAGEVAAGVVVGVVLGGILSSLAN